MVTATQLSSYLYCPRKLFISSVLLVEEPPKEELVKGTVWHKTYELINTSERDIVLSLRTANYQDIYDAYRRAFAKFLRGAIINQKSALATFNLSLVDLFNDYWPHFEEEAKTRAMNLSTFIKTHNVFGEALWSALTPKILSEQYFKSESLNLSGVIDVIEVHKTPTGEIYVPVELKTGKYPEKGMWDGHRIQLAAYLTLLESQGKTVAEGVLCYKGSPDKRVLPFNPLVRQEVQETIRKVSAITGSFDIPEKVAQKTKCEKCSFKHLCYDDAKMAELVSAVSKR